MLNLKKHRIPPLLDRRLLCIGLSVPSIGSGSPKSDGKRTPPSFFPLPRSCGWNEVLGIRSEVYVF